MHGISNRSSSIAAWIHILAWWFCSSSRVSLQSVVLSMVKVVSETWRLLLFLAAELSVRCAVPCVRVRVSSRPAGSPNSTTMYSFTRKWENIKSSRAARARGKRKSRINYKNRILARHSTSSSTRRRFPFWAWVVVSCSVFRKHKNHFVQCLSLEIQDDDDERHERTVRGYEFLK